jgi:PHP family Zn ribbon phosphoesterase
MHRVHNLADREEGYTPNTAIPCKYTIPLEEIISTVKAKGVGSASVKREYLQLTSNVGSEVDILLFYSEETLNEVLSKELAEAIISMREGRVEILPGYDGVYGKIILSPSSAKKEDEKIKESPLLEKKAEQLTLF